MLASSLLDYVAGSSVLHSATKAKKEEEKKEKEKERMSIHQVRNMNIIFRMFLMFII